MISRTLQNIVCGIKTAHKSISSRAMSGIAPRITLNNGQTCPAFGLGTWQVCFIDRIVLFE